MKAVRCILITVAILASLAVGFVTGRGRANKPPTTTPTAKVDTLVIRDTITVSNAVYLTKRVIDSVMVPVTDTVRLRDTLFVFLEREQVRWEDSLAVVYASGIRPQVDSVIHFRTDRYIIHEIPVAEIRKTRWGIGIQAGWGASREGVTPYIGAGVTYNIISF